MSRAISNRCYFPVKRAQKGTHLIDVHWLLFRLYGLHLDVLTELHRLLLCLHCRFTRKVSK